jgi:hypothetical protein
VSLKERLILADIRILAGAKIALFGPSETGPSSRGLSSRTNHVTKFNSSILITGFNSSILITAIYQHK